MKEKILKEFSELDEQELMFIYSMSISASKIMNTADSVPNKMKCSIANSCGDMVAEDGTKYQAKVIIVADESQWRDKDIIEVLSPFNKVESVKDFNMNDIN